MSTPAVTAGGEVPKVSLTSRLSALDQTVSSELRQQLGADQFALFQRENQQLQQRYASQKQKPVTVGDLAPDFLLPDQNGEEVRLSSLLQSSHVVIHFYRGSWCSFCNVNAAGSQRVPAGVREPRRRLHRRHALSARGDRTAARLLALLLPHPLRRRAQSSPPTACSWRSRRPCCASTRTPAVWASTSRLTTATPRAAADPCDLHRGEEERAHRVGARQRGLQAASRAVDIMLKLATLMVDGDERE